MRSGGHSYTCTSLKEGSLHIDLREMDEVTLTRTNKSSTGLAAVLGPGQRWGRVQEILPFERYMVALTSYLWSRHVRSSRSVQD